ncbi:hypothetical protein PC123_g6296 [Phytophthora cactorum]|nr:hypothetical protein PC123_g6296 [Phytophthora cactorum]
MPLNGRRRLPRVCRAESGPHAPQGDRDFGRLAKRTRLQKYDVELDVILEPIGGAGCCYGCKGCQRFLTQFRPKTIGHAIHRSGMAHQLTLLERVVGVSCTRGPHGKDLDTVF